MASTSTIAYFKPGLFTEYAPDWLVCTEDQRWSVVIDYINSQYVLLHRNHEVQRFYKWDELEAYVRKQLAA